MDRLSDFFARTPVFTRDEFTASLVRSSTNPRAIEAKLAYHVKGGSIVRIRRGLYCSVPPGERPATYVPDPYVIVGKLAPDAVIAYHSALEVHGLAHSVFRRLTVLTRVALRGFTFRDLEFVAVRPLRSLARIGALDYGVETVSRGAATIRVTSVERTMVDVLDRPDVSGGLAEVWESLESSRGVHALRVLEYLRAIGNRTTAARVGYFVDLHRDAFLVEEGGTIEETIEELRGLAPRQPVYFDACRVDPQRMVSRWNLMVPETLLPRRDEATA